MKITLATLPQATAQQVFDQVSEHLLRQNMQSMSDLVCLYRGPGGLQCAAGALISDDEYARVVDAGLENEGWYVLVSDSIAPHEHCDLIDTLQALHDDSSPHTWREKLSRVAANFSLSPRIVEEFKS